MELERHTLTRDLRSPRPSPIRATAYTGFQKSVFRGVFDCIQEDIAGRIQVENRPMDWLFRKPVYAVASEGRIEAHGPSRQTMIRRRELRIERQKRLKRISSRPSTESVSPGRHRRRSDKPRTEE